MSYLYALLLKNSASGSAKRRVQRRQASNLSNKQVKHETRQGFVASPLTTCQSATTLAREVDLNATTTTMTKKQQTRAPANQKRCHEKEAKDTCNKPSFADHCTAEGDMHNHWNRVSRREEREFCRKWQLTLKLVSRFIV